MDNYNIDINNSTFDRGSSVVKKVYEGAAVSQDRAILRELQEIQHRLEKTEPMIADALSNLAQAIQAQDKPSISKFIHQLSNGTVKSLLSTIASKALLSFLGIG